MRRSGRSSTHVLRVRWHPADGTGRMSENPFAEKDGPWALIAGASGGDGPAFPRALAVRGVSVVLLARRQKVRDEVADPIRAETGVGSRAAPSVAS